MRRPSKRVLAAAGLVVAAGCVTAVILATSGSSPSTAARAASTSTSTTRITRQDLVETDTEDGTLGYADTRSVINRLSGTVTWLPSQGAVIKPDHALYKVDGKPVILMSGQVPVYRALTAGIIDGPDIRQLESTLKAAGYDPSGLMTVNDIWGAGTTAAVKRWQKAHGFNQTGTIALGEIIFLPGARRIATMSVTLGGPTSGGGGGGGGASNASASAAQLAAGAGNRALIAYVSSREVAQTTPATTAPTTTTPRTTPTTPTTPTTSAPAPATTTTPSTTTPRTPATTTPTTTTPATTTPSGRSGTGGSGSSGSGGSGSSGSGGSGSNGSGGSSSVANAIMTTTSTKRVVKVALDTTKSSLAVVGARVSVDLPSGDTVHGRISSVGKVATSTSSSNSGGGGGGGSSDSGATISVTIHLSAIHTSLDQAPVTVGFEQSRRKNVLAIPVTALLAQPGGAYAVEVVAADGSHRIVPVQTGLYTSGYVEIEGDGLQPGMRVTNAAV